MLTTIVSKLAGLLTPEMILSLAASLVALVWTRIKRSEWVRERAEDRSILALEALEAGAVFSYESFVRNIKKGDGRKLTKSEREVARNKAIARAKVIGDRKGISVLEELGGTDLLDMWLESIVRKLKKGRKP